ncbi:MAG: hypothetical protein A2342_02905 [Gallionellales bacterium RIFOXYB12_FULL_54_9]|nr:MAG: hypothetical protein A2342_02905 [Gallionellales bacterium RIFOXYB12_FULL_54_9]
MKTKKSVQVEETVVQTVAAKPLGKPAVKKVLEPAKETKTFKAAKDVEGAGNVVKAVKTAKATKIVKEPKPPKKPQVVRDSFTMPENEYLKIAEIKEKGLKAGLQIKKSEVLRAGLKALCTMDEAHLRVALTGLDKIKTGRPNKH